MLKLDDTDRIPIIVEDMPPHWGPGVLITVESENGSSTYQISEIDGKTVLAWFMWGTENTGGNSVAHDGEEPHTTKQNGGQ